MLSQPFFKQFAGRRPGLAGKTIRFAPELAELAKLDAASVHLQLRTSADGLTEEAAQRRLATEGPNVVDSENAPRWPTRLLSAVRDPLVLLLLVLAGISFATGDVHAGTLMAVMVLLGVSLRFVQESRADAAAEKLKAMIHLTATVVRLGQERELPLREIVPGDVVRLSAGDMVPADVRVVAAKDLFVTQSALTGESLPVEKSEHPDCRGNCSPLDLANLCFLGTSVESGAATAVVVATGARTYFGSMAESLVEEAPDTSFDRGVRDFTWLMIRFLVVMVPLVFVMNVLSKHHWREAFFFAVAVAVGLTPEMLPMIVSVCLSKGALAMARKRVIVKQLNAIENLGAMDVLCTDKTGTLTQDQVILERHCDVMQNENEDVLLHAYLIAHFQSGLRNVLDRAVLKHREAHEKLSIQDYRRLDEIPFDFARRMMSVLVETPDGDHQLLSKGAPEAVFERCSFFELDGRIYPMEPLLVGDLIQQYQQLSSEGFRVLAVAHKHFDAQPALRKEDECDLILKGYVAFLDPPKESASKAIRALQAHGVSIKVLTGDNDRVARKVCEEVGLSVGEVVLGSGLDALSDAHLAETAEAGCVFARLTPAHKQRIVRALQSKGHVVGFTGDGINDAPALHAADVGISVDSAVDIAKASAGVILLEKDLGVLDEAVIEGRKVFVNILKYVRMGASSNFGNMVSVLGASVFLPFLPMAPIQVLTNNLLYDFSQIPIPTDTVGPDQTAKPRPWLMNDILKFVLWIGPISSLFDYTTFLVLLYSFGCWDPQRKALFQTGWFVESLVTQTLVIHVIRTNKIPFVSGRASWQVTLTTLLVIAVAIWLPFSPVAEALGFTPLPPTYWPVLAATALCYVALTQAVKTWLFSKMAI